MYPVYVVVYESSYSNVPPLSYYGLPRQILAVVSCDVSDIQTVYDKYVTPFQQQGRQVQALYLSREPDSFLRETLPHD